VYTYLFFVNVIEIFFEGAFSTVAATIFKDQLVAAPPHISSWLKKTAKKLVALYFHNLLDKY
jgi:hypothetical protein